METQQMELYARQGEVTIIKLADAVLPDWPALPMEDGKLIVGHSETGHHHVIERPASVKIVRKIDTGAMTVLRAIVTEPTRVVHLRAHDTHMPINLPPGVYEFRGQVEYDPYEEKIRRAAD
jgi:hypothetical protein